MNSKLNFLLSAFSVALISCPSVLAQSSENHTTIEVRLSIAADTSAEQAYKQIQTAASRACRTRAIYPHQQLARTQQCKTQFISDAVARFGRPQLTALHTKRTNNDVPKLADG